MWNNGDDTTGTEAIELQDLGKPDPNISLWEKLPPELWANIAKNLDSGSSFNARTAHPKYFGACLSPNITPPPITATPPILQTINCPSPILSLVEYSPDILVSGHGGGNIRFWNMNNGALLKTLPRNHIFPVKHLVVFRDNWLISGSDDKICIWNQEGNFVRSFNVDVSLVALAAARNSSWFAFTDKYEEWEESFESNVFRYQPRLRAANFIDPSPRALSFLLSLRPSKFADNPITNIGRDRIAFPDQNNEVIVFNFRTGNTDGKPLKLNKPWLGGYEIIKYLAPLGTCFLACGIESGTNGAYCDNAKGNIYIWSWRTGNLILKITSSNKGRMQPILSMTAFDHGELVTIHSDRKLCIWDCKTGQLRDFRDINIPDFTVPLSNFRFASAINNRNNSYIGIENLRAQQPKSKPQNCVIQ